MQCVFIFEKEGGGEGGDEDNLYRSVGICIVLFHVHGPVHLYAIIDSLSAYGFK